MNKRFYSGVAWVGLMSLFVLFISAIKEQAIRLNIENTKTMSIVFEPYTKFKTEDGKFFHAFGTSKCPTVSASFFEQKLEYKDMDCIEISLGSEKIAVGLLIDNQWQKEEWTIKREISDVGLIRFSLVRPNGSHVIPVAS